MRRELLKSAEVRRDDLGIPSLDGTGQSVGQPDAGEVVERALQERNEGLESFAGLESGASEQLDGEPGTGDEVVRSDGRGGVIESLAAGSQRDRPGLQHPEGSTQGSDGDRISFEKAEGPREM